MFLNRKFTIRNANDFFAKNCPEGKNIFGNWAPAITWDCNSKILVTTRPNLLKENLINEIENSLVISEPDESDSNQLYKNNGIDLFSISDSVVQIVVAEYPLNIFWIKTYKYAP